MSDYSIYCDDGCTQPLSCRKLSNGKYVLIRSTVMGSGMVGEPETVVSEEYEDIRIYNDFFSPAYIFVKKLLTWRNF